MRKYGIILLCFAILITMASWGAIGHRAIASIAEKHLNANVKAVVSSYLNGENITEAATWADEIRDDQQYKSTGPWHFLNLPLGLTRAQFSEYVTKQDKDNTYTAILKAEANLRDNTLSATQKAEALKFLIHFIGDAHQPMHVSREEDKGGNTIQLRYEGKGTNLHSLWDSKLIDHEGLNNAEMTTQYDLATPEQIKKWQSDSPMQWMWESYQISSTLYKGVKAGQTIDDVYYKKAIPIIRQRISQAGIRLAGELNRLLKDQSPVKQVTTVDNNKTTTQAVAIKLADVKSATGKTVVVTGKVYGAKDIGSMVLVNLGASYPNQILTVALKGSAKVLADKIDGKVIKVEGTVIDYKGRPEVIITEPAQIQIMVNP
jgi:hypothetical protein